MYTITNGKVTKTANTLEQAEKMAKQLTVVFNEAFKIQQHKDVWNVNNDK